MGEAQTRWQNSLAAHQDALRVQAGVVQALDTSRTETNGLVSSSQSAAGILQASQAGNQLIALQTRQLVDLTALIAAQARAQSLDGARNTANQEQARVQLNQFLIGGRGYQPQTVQMFHQTATCGSPTSGSRTRPHAFTHGTSCPSRHRRTSPKCP